MQFQLEPEQELLFTRLVEASRSVPRAQRQPFNLIRTVGMSLVRGNGFGEQVLQEDLLALEDVGLIRVVTHGLHGFSFVIPPGALPYYEELKAGQGEAPQQVEEEVGRYLDAAAFQQRYPTAYARWRQAAELPWRSASPDELSTIGHKCREAIQEFVAALIDRHDAAGVNPDKAMTRDRFSAVLAVRRPQLGERRSELLDALFGYWKAAADLIQRQEHAGNREAAPLVWEDGRRVVFQTAIVMFEIDRTL